MTIDDSIAAVRLTPTRHAKLGPGFAQKTRRRCLDLLLKVMAIVVLAGAVLVPAAPAPDSQEGHWTGTWAASPSFAEGNTRYTDQTLRLIVRTTGRQPGSSEIFEHFRIKTSENWRRSYRIL